MKFVLILMFLVGCSTPTVKKTFDEKRIENVEKCVLKMLENGFHEQLIYPMCKDIYSRRPLESGV